MLRTACAALVAASLLAWLPAVAANHAQPLPAGGTITFKDKAGGNEWWVEAIVTTSASVSKVEVMDDGGPWAAMTPHPDWGSWALSYHVEPGHMVTFRATTSAGTVTSCPFTHPAGVEQCGTTPPPPPPPPPPPGSFDATFTGVRGNEWWVQANVGTNGPAVSKVDVTLDGGASWKALAKQTWGPTAWAASYHIVQGTVVQLRATASGGATDLSDCYKWIPASNTDATKVACPGAPPPPPPPPPPTGFDATFSNVKGNDYWLEAVITANEQVQGVFVYFDCDPNQEPADMSYHADWGKWTLGSPIPRGAKVTMLAFGDHGSEMSQGYTWPQATPTSGCPPPPNWPRDGSYAVYDLHNDLSGAGTEDHLFARLRIDFHAVPGQDFLAITATCTGRHTHKDVNGTTTADESWTTVTSIDPPVMTRTPRVGMTINPWNQPDFPAVEKVGDDCMSDNGTDWSGTVMGTKTATTAVAGPMTVWYTDENDGGTGIEDREIQWETNAGLVLHWEREGRRPGMAIFGGDLVATDFPVG